MFSPIFATPTEKSFPRLYYHAPICCRWRQFSGVHAADAECSVAADYEQHEDSYTDDALPLTTTSTPPCCTPDDVTRYLRNNTGRL